AALGAPARSAKSGQTTSDEPQYLLSAISLFEDLDLDISDELAEERYRDFHAADLPQQTQPRPDGSRISPHDPLLPVVLAAPTAAGGWLGARLAMATMAGVLAALTAWVAVVRFGVSTRWAVLVVGGLSVTAPLVAYGSQLYPELPAALVVMTGVAALTGPLGRRGQAVAALSVVALPWLAVKYTPVAAALAVAAVVLLARRGDGRRAGVLVGVLAVAGVAYLWFHQGVYGGWTAYASGDHFVDGELLALGTDPDPGGRAYRLAGLLTDRDFGLVAWAPAYLLVVAAVVAFVRARPQGWAIVVGPLAVGWLNATFVAESMHDWSWPGRQVVVVLPLAVLVTAWWIDRVRAARLPFALLTAVALFLWAWLQVEIAARGTSFSLAVDFHRTDNPLYGLWTAVRPDHRNPSASTGVVAVLWIAVLGLFAWWGHRSVRPRDVVHGDQDQLGLPNTGRTHRLSATVEER
ncbi:MAG: hypothetical protein AAGK32_08865, partial [Actinomycetota bacterium]